MAPSNSSPTGVELVVTRRYDFPPERVYDAWLDPESLGRWLFATSTGVMQRVEVDPRVGGEFVVVEKRGELLAEHFGKYLELERPRRIVFEFRTDRSMLPTIVTVLIAGTESGCELRLSHHIPPEWAAHADKARGGWTRILEGLAATLRAAREPLPGEVLIERTINAPREAVFAAWTDPRAIGKWFAPRGCTIEFRQIEIAPGGTFHSCIRTPDGHECWCAGRYLEIVSPERIVLTMSVCDAAGKIIEPQDAGMDPDWPRETVVTVTLRDLGGKTGLTLHQTVSEALAKRTGAHPSWLQMLDLMEEQLTAR
jgi:uncharacterized protein YndB with AHSA1/START domain